MMIRRAREDEADELISIVAEATRHWGYPQEWVETAAAGKFDLNDVFVAEGEDGVQGFYKLSAQQPKPEELWVAPAYFGTGVGKELYLHARETRRSLGAIGVGPS